MSVVTLVIFPNCLIPLVHDMCTWYFLYVYCQLPSLMLSHLDTNFWTLGGKKIHLLLHRGEGGQKLPIFVLRNMCTAPYQFIWFFSVLSLRVSFLRCSMRETRRTTLKANRWTSSTLKISSLAVHLNRLMSTRCFMLWNMTWNSR